MTSGTPASWLLTPCAPPALLRSALTRVARRSSQPRSVGLRGGFCLLGVNRVVCAALSGLTPLCSLRRSMGLVNFKASEQAERLNEAAPRSGVGLNKLLGLCCLKRDPLDATCYPLCSEFFEPELVMECTRSGIRRINVVLTSDRSYSLCVSEVE